ncbi:MAG: 3-deoxy-manno-octulosonate cytidylyltransferase [Proteobacteria bacterium]|nr:3-deoxy-manno-octulosonate cytidylyltransferase [Pseudomonadota bacterium]
MSLSSNAIILIPARLQAQRFPRKPLAMLSGKPMILHVLEAVKKSGIGDIIVAAAETELQEVVEKAGFSCVLTDPNHPSGSDRIFEALQRVDPFGQKEIIVNVQGDLPVLDMAMIPLLLDTFKNPHVDIATAVTPFKENENPEDPNRVKAAVAWENNGNHGRALYFSRCPIPFKAQIYYHHIGIYAYRRHALEKFISYPVGFLENEEKLEQLRALENGMWIEAIKVDTSPLSVDTPEDLEYVEAYLKTKSFKG